MFLVNVQIDLYDFKTLGVIIYCSGFLCCVVSLMVKLNVAKGLGIRCLFLGSHSTKMQFFRYMVANKLVENLSANVCMLVHL